MINDVLKNRCQWTAGLPTSKFVPGQYFVGPNFLANSEIEKSKKMATVRLRISP